ncbi:hypothetical protein [Rhizobium sp. Leaf383]|uniref:hypothetical protein n=1 Tax=Rhizobium sp. Leaf383 TaxID=1736357 RepID=UPI0007143F72|nr:hypothetical protein [Rhizobium sp. Leaf383]KQS75970.1 hypothetical protein ASG58_14185 [Rhizobium sp. Leaf383]
MSVHTLDRSKLAKGKIRALADEHGLRGEFTTFDARASQISQLSGERKTELDETELLLTALRRAGVVTGIDAVRLHADYLAR